MPEIFYKVSLDIEYRLVWDKYLKGNSRCFLLVNLYVKKILCSEAREINDGEKTGIYWQLIMPLFIDNRDVCFLII